MNTKATAAQGWQSLSIKDYMKKVQGINPFSMIGKNWMLIGAGSAEDYNAMTASWGGLGILWNKNVSFCFVRPSRHTYTYTEKASHYTLSFFDPEHKKALQYFGSVSGRDEDKAAGSGLHPIFFDDGQVSFAEASLVLVCRKLYIQNMEKSLFLDTSVLPHFYPADDFHRVYVGEIERVWIQES